MIGTPMQLIRILSESPPDKKWVLDEFKEKRSLNQNALYWKYCGEVAKKTRIKAARIHNENLRALGQVEKVGDKLVTLYIPDTDEAEEAVLNSETFHLRPTSETRKGKDGVMYRGYILLRGSHTFDVQTMSALLDLMIEEAKAQGVETLTKRELEQIREIERRRSERHNG